MFWNDCHGRIRRAAAVALLLLAIPARADLLITSGGESLSGALTRITDGILVFRTSLKGQMMVPVTEVKSLTTETSWVITDTRGTVFVGRFAPGGVLEPSTEGEGTLRSLDLAAIDSAKSSPGSTGATNESKPTEWRVSAGTGVDAFSGTEDGVSPSLRLNAKNWGESLNTSLQLNFDPTATEFPAHLSGTLELTEAARTDPWGPFLRGEIERDASNALDYRTGLTLGMRYRFSETPTGLEALLGVGAAHGEWRRTMLERGASPGDVRADRRSELNALLGLRYTAITPSGLEWTSTLQFQPSLTDADDFRANAETALEYPVTDRLRLRLDMRLRYENDPALDGLEPWRTRVGAGLNWNF